jgi:NADH:ubiquinone reductase (H+-translocating)
MKKTRIVIIGAGYAGVMTALRLAGKDKHRLADITLVNPTDQFVERIRNHQFAADVRIRQHSIRKLLGSRPVSFVQGWVTALDVQRRVVQVDVDGETREIDYDKLVYTPGSVAARSNIPGVAEHTYNVATRPDAAALRDRLAELAPGSRVAIVGGGLTGIESATEIAEAYPQLQVSLVTAGAPGKGLSSKGQAYLAKTFEVMGIQVHDHTRVRRVEAGAVITESGARIEFDACVWAGSFEAVPLARESGLAVNAKGQMLIDPYMRSISHPDIYGAGDGAAPVDDPGAPLRMACAVALPMGAHTADNLLALLEGRPQQPFNFGYVVQCVSLGRRRGLLQFVHADDSPQERVVTGRMGAIAKELICQFAFQSLPAERMFPGAFLWLGKGAVPANFDERISQHV